MKKITLILIGLFLATNVYGGCTGLLCPPIVSGPITATCEGKEYNLDDPALERCRERVRAEEVKKAEERAEQARKEEEERIRVIVKDELGYSDLVKGSQDLVRENTLLKIENAQLERDNFNLEKRVSFLEGLIEMQMRVIELFKVLLSRLNLL